MEEEEGGQGSTQCAVRDVGMDVIENGAVAWLAVPQVGQGDSIKVVKAVCFRVVAVVTAMFTVQAQVPFACREITKC